MLVAVVLGGGATYSWAAGKEAAQTINTCANEDGQLRLVAVAGNCKKDETEVSWNTVGPVGPVGPQGTAGRNGQTGPQGPAGSSAPNPDAAAGTLTVTGQKQGAFPSINLMAVSHEIVSPRDAASGLPTDKRQHKPITITKELDASTPLLLNALVTNETLTSVLIGLLRNGQPIATISSSMRASPTTSSTARSRRGPSRTRRSNGRGWTATSPRRTTGSRATRRH